MATQRSLGALGAGLLAGVALTALANPAAAQCFPEWSTIGTGFNASVNDFAVVDFGSGEQLFAGGAFSTADGLPASFMARWNGAFWESMPTTNSTVNCLIVHDSGSGDRLYAGGEFTSAGTTVNRVATFNGAAWSPLGTGVNGSVYTLAAIESGPLAGVYAGGAFTTADGAPANRVAKWNGTTWQPLGAGLNGNVRALAVFDAGFGPALYAAGEFTIAGGLPANRIARWDGFSWSPLGVGVNNIVRTLASYDGQLYAGGTFTQAGGVTANRIARWNGASWSIPGTGGANSTVEKLIAYHDGVKNTLVAGGAFATMTGVSCSRIAVFDGAAWSALGSGVNNTVFAVRPFDDGGGASLMVGGNFTTAGGIAAARAARFRGCPHSVVPIPGCASNPADLVGLTALPKIGTVFSCRLEPTGVPSGFSVLFMGANGVNLAGCGFFLPGLGEVLLAPAPAPTTLVQQAFAGGSSTFNLPIPNDPSLVGLVLGFQSAAVALTPGFPVQLSTALSVKIRP